MSKDNPQRFRDRRVCHRCRRSEHHDPAIKRKLVTTLFFSFIAWLALGKGALTANRLIHPSEVELDRLIPREKWPGTGLDKLTAAEQQTLADEISGLLVGSGIDAEQHSCWKKQEPMAHVAQTHDKG